MNYKELKNIIFEKLIPILKINEGVSICAKSQSSIDIHQQFEVKIYRKGKSLLDQMTINVS